MRVCKDCGRRFKYSDPKQYRCPIHERKHRTLTNRRTYDRRKAEGKRTGTTGAQRRFAKEVFEIHGRVCRCGKPATTAGHIIELSQGGSNDARTNGAPECEGCNFSRRDSRGKR